MKNILYIIPGFLEVGGISRYNRSLLDALLEDGYNVRVISRNDVVSAYRGAHITFLGRIKNLFLRKIFFSVKVFYESVILQPDLIICGHVNFSNLCYAISKFFNKRYIILFYGVEAWNTFSESRKAALKEASSVICISEFTKSKMIAQVPELTNKVFVLPPTVDSQFFEIRPKPAHLLKRYGIRQEDKVILTVARLEKKEGYKGYYQILGIMPFILSGFPQAKYIIVGGGNDLDNIKMNTSGAGLGNSVIFSGHIRDDELPDYYNLCDVFIMPSRGEGFGIVFLEALACGKPVIAGNKDASKEALLNGEVGILLDPADSSSIADWIIRILKKEVDPRFLDGDYLRKRTIETYGFDRFRKNVRELLKT